MTKKQSTVSGKLIHLDDELDFCTYAAELVRGSSRSIHLLSHTLDPLVYSREEFCDALSALVRKDRNCYARILVKDIQPLVENGHRLLNLARRLSSKIEIRRMQAQPKNTENAYLIGDGSRILYKHDDLAYRGWVNYDAAPECRSLLEEFNYLWDKHSEVDTRLRTLVL